MRNVYVFKGHVVVGGGTSLPLIDFQSNSAAVSLKSYIEGDKLVPVGEYNFRVLILLQRGMLRYRYKEWMKKARSVSAVETSMNMSLLV